MFVLLMNYLLYSMAQKLIVVCMFRRSRAEEISEFFALPIAKNEIAVFYLGVSGVIARTASLAVLFDPAGFLKDDEVTALKGVKLLLFTHSHSDHFSVGRTQALINITGASVLAEARVAAKLRGKIPADKLVSAESGKTYTFGDVAASAIVGVHRGPIMLYRVKLGGIALFHAGDSGYVSLKDYPSDIAFLPRAGGRLRLPPKMPTRWPLTLSQTWLSRCTGQGSRSASLKPRLRKVCLRLQC